MFFYKFGEFAAYECETTVMLMHEREFSQSAFETLVQQAQEVVFESVTESVRKLRHEEAVSHIAWMQRTVDSDKPYVTEAVRDHYQQLIKDNTKALSEPVDVVWHEILGAVRQHLIDVHGFVQIEVTAHYVPEDSTVVGQTHPLNTE
jgi:hypothetical protein